MALLGDPPPFPFLRLLLRQGEVHSMYKGDIFQGLPRTISIITCIRESGLQPSLLSSKDAARNCRPTSVSAAGGTATEQFCCHTASSEQNAAHSHYLP